MQEEEDGETRNEENIDAEEEDKKTTGTTTTTATATAIEEKKTKRRATIVEPTTDKDGNKTTQTTTTKTSQEERLKKLTISTKQEAELRSHHENIVWRDFTFLAVALILASVMSFVELHSSEVEMRGGSVEDVSRGGIVDTGFILTRYAAGFCVFVYISNEMLFLPLFFFGCFSHTYF